MALFNIKNVDDQEAEMQMSLVVADDCYVKYYIDNKYYGKSTVAPFKFIVERTDIIQNAHVELWLDNKKILESSIVAIDAKDISTRALQGNKYALIVGISDYKLINDLSFCDEDATDWYNYLRSKKYQIQLYGDAHRSNYPIYNGLATEINVRKAFRAILAKATDNDTVMLVTSGHGSGDGKGNSYICLYGCNPNVDADCYRDKELLADILGAKNKPKIVIFIDNCYSGGFLDEVVKLPNVCCLTTCSKNGYGYDDSKHQNGAWTYCYLQKGLIETFKGNAPIATVFSWAATNYAAISGNRGAGDQPQMVNNLGNTFAI